MTIVFSSSDFYAPLLGVALCSIFENTNTRMKVVVLDDGISPRNKKRLRTVEEKYGFCITYLTPPPPSYFKDIPLERFTAIPYNRLCWDTLLPLEKKIVCLDCDILAEGDIAEMFTIDLEGKIIAAVPDRCQKDRQKHLKELCGKEGKYFNCGILLIDLDAWRKNDVQKENLDFIRKRGYLDFSEQDSLNATLEWKELDMKYNFIAVRNNAIHLDHPIIVHFAGGLADKPWYVFSTIPYHADWLQYAFKTPWWKTIKIIRCEKFERAKYFIKRSLLDLYE